MTLEDYFHLLRFAKTDFDGKGEGDDKRKSGEMEIRKKSRQSNFVDCRKRKIFRLSKAKALLSVKNSLCIDSRKQ